MKLLRIEKFDKSVCVDVDMRVYIASAFQCIHVIATDKILLYNDDDWDWMQQISLNGMSERLEQCKP